MNHIKKELLSKQLMSILESKNEIFCVKMMRQKLKPYPYFLLIALIVTDGEKQMELVVTKDG